MKEAIPDPIYKYLKVESSRASGHWPKISHIYGTGRHPSFKHDIRMEYDDPHHWHARWPPSWQLWVAVQVTTCRGRGHIVSAPHQASRLTACFPLS